MILVTLGTHPKPMDRLTVALDDILSSGDLRDEIIITGPNCGKQPSLARAVGIQPYDVLVEWARSSRAMITHAGPASIALALSVGHSPIVVPRDPALGEHVDDHQLRFAAWLAKRRDISVVLDMRQLGGALQEALSRQRRASPSVYVPNEAIARLRLILDEGR